MTHRPFLDLHQQINHGDTPSHPKTTTHYVLQCGTLTLCQNFSQTPNTAKSSTILRSQDLTLWVLSKPTSAGHICQSNISHTNALNMNLNMFTRPTLTTHTTPASARIDKQEEICSCRQTNFVTGFSNQDMTPQV